MGGRPKCWLVVAMDCRFSAVFLVTRHLGSTDLVTCPWNMLLLGFWFPGSAILRPTGASEIYMHHKLGIYQIYVSAIISGLFSHSVQQPNVIWSPHLMHLLFSLSPCFSNNSERFSCMGNRMGNRVSSEFFSQMETILKYLIHVSLINIAEYCALCSSAFLV